MTEILELFERPHAIADRVDDERLLERARRGSEDAFSLLFARYRRSLFRYAAHMCGRDTADDIVQSTFMEVLRGTGRFDPSRGTFAHYLFGIARHQVLRVVASRNAQAGGQGDAQDGEGVDLLSPDDHLERAETIDRVRSAIRSLPAVYREVVVLCELQEMDYTSVARLIQCPTGTVRSRLHRARALLAAKLAVMRQVLR